MQKQYVVRLSDEERGTLMEVLKKFKETSQKVRGAQVFLKADADGPAWTDTRIADAVGVSIQDSRERSPATGRVCIKGNVGEQTAGTPGDRETPERGAGGQADRPAT